MERTTRIAAAAFVVIGGLVHLQLWRTGYREIPYIGNLSSPTWWSRPSWLWSSWSVAIER